VTDWSAYVAYWCPTCHSNCINREDHPATQANRCKDCFDVPSIDTTSEGAGELVRPEAQRSEHPGTEGERQSHSAPARPPGSDPSRVDPEARAFSPNPAGEGNRQRDVQGDSDHVAQTDGRK